MQGSDWTKPCPLLLAKQGKTAIKVAQKQRTARKLAENGGVHKKWTSISTSSPHPCADIHFTHRGRLEYPSAFLIVIL